MAAAGPRAACALRSVRLPVALHRRLSLKTAKEEKRREVLDFGGVKRRLKLIPRVPSETARKEPAARPCGEKPPPPAAGCVCPGTACGWRRSAEGRWWQEGIAPRHLHCGHAITVV